MTLCADVQRRIAVSFPQEILARTWGKLCRDGRQDSRTTHDALHLTEVCGYFMLEWTW